MITIFLYILTFLFVQFHQAPLIKFQEQTIDANISIGYGLAIGDVDGDGKPDILLADKKQFVWYRNGDWKRFVMIENLTAFDNVCIAARDINGDGMVEVAVGAQWNPSETSDTAQSGSVHYLIRPKDPTQLWKAVELHHEPTIHRMKWVKGSDGKYWLVVLPLHGRGNQGGKGAGVRILAYQFPNNAEGPWKTNLLDSSLHLTHNFDLLTTANQKQDGLYIASKEGIAFHSNDFSNVSDSKVQGNLPMTLSAGEVRIGKLSKDKQFIATIEPMHGNSLVVYLLGNDPRRILLDSNLKEGHALAISDFSASGVDQVLVGWRQPDKDGKVGIKLYTMRNISGAEWESQWIDENGMACEDIQVADLDGDGKPDIVASGRSTKNLKIYWNITGK
ncbi:MAG: FG-GAP repeat domain-containing protein [Chitinophagales bacterium]